MILCVTLRAGPFLGGPTPTSKMVKGNFGRFCWDDTQLHIIALTHVHIITVSLTIGDTRFEAGSV